MNINELTEILRQPFTTEKGFGAMKLHHADKMWSNIYFVVPTPPPRNIKCKLSPELLGQALRVIASLPSLSEMTEKDKLVNFLFVRREVVQSSRLEGTWSTIDHALTPGEIFDDNEGQGEHQAVRSYAGLLEDIVREAELSKESIFTKDFVCNIQKKIVENDPNSYGVPGKIRTEGEKGSIVTIGGGIRRENSIYNPCPASEVERCLEEVLEWLRDDELAQMGDAGLKGLSLPVRLALSHAHFEAVHPFTDGNGRTGRALWPIQMVCAGHMPLYLSGFVEMYKDDYASSLECAQKQLNYAPLIEFICNAIIESSLENSKTSEAIRNLENEWMERGNFRKNSGAQKALLLLLTSPIISTSVLQEELGISKTASTDTINSLVKRKIIRFRKTENRKRIYAAEELIQILSRPFGSDIDLALEKAHGLLGI